MTTLFEKLVALSNKPPAPPPDPPAEQEQCECGGGIAGECSDCTEPGPALGTELLARLREIGDQKQVNPPPVPSARQEDITTRPPPVPVLVSPPEAPALGGTCPLCAKTFQHLSRHKCKVPALATAVLPREGIRPDWSITDREPPPTPTPEGTPRGYWLFLDALFERAPVGPVHHLSQLLAPLAHAVAAENGQEHWGAVEYGRGGPLLAAKVERMLAEGGPLGVVLADSSTPECRACLEILKKHAQAVVRGYR